MSNDSPDREEAVDNDASSMSDILPNYDETPLESPPAMALLSEQDARRFHEGVVLLHAEESVEALQLWRELAEAYPNHAFTHFNLGLAYTQFDEHHQARLQFDLAYELDPTLQVAKVNSGEAFKGSLTWDMINSAFKNKCRELQNREATVELFETIEDHLAIWPLSFFGHERKAMALYFNDRPQEAVKQAEIAIFINSLQPSGFYARARARFDLGDPEGAFFDLQKCIERHQEHDLNVTAEMWLRLAEFAHAAALAQKDAAGRPLFNDSPYAVDRVEVRL